MHVMKRSNCFLKTYYWIAQRVVEVFQLFWICEKDMIMDTSLWQASLGNISLSTWNNCSNTNYIQYSEYCYLIVSTLNSIKVTALRLYIKFHKTPYIHFLFYNFAILITYIFWIYIYKNKVLEINKKLGLYITWQCWKMED